MAAVKDELLHLGRTILHAYFEETNLGPLLAHLAPDVIWLGAGQEMLAEGRTAVTAIFEKGQDQLIPCRQSQERTLVRSLGDGLWLVQICSLVETDPSYKMYLQAYQRCAFCFRKNQAGDWEIAYLNHSMAYEAVRENELFAISQGIRNFRKLKTADPNLFTPQDKELMYQLIRKLFQPLSREEQQVCLTLSLFPRFSRAQAEFICPHPDTLARLEEHWKRSPFLAYEPSQGTFAFHPVFQEYLQGQFQEESWSWQKKAYIRATRWQLHSGDFAQAFALALKGKAWPQALQAVERAGLAILYQQPSSLLIQLLRKCPPEEKARHFAGCALILLALNLLQSPQTAREEREILLASLPDDWAYTPEDQARILFLTALDSLPDLDALEPACRQFFAYCRQHHIRLPRDYFQGIHRGVSGQLVLYYRRAGSLARNTRQLQALYDGCGETLQGVSGPLWRSAVAAELAYLQGELSTAEEVLQAFLDAPCQTLDEQQRAIIALFLVPRIALIRQDQEQFLGWKKHYRKLSQLITDPLTRTDLDLVGIFVQSLLEQPSPSLEKHLERMNSLPDYPSLQGMRQSTRHRLQLTMGRYQLLLLSTRPQDAVPSPTSSQMCRCYDAIVQIAALEHTGLGEEAAALLRSTLAEALEDKLYLPFVEHQSLLGPMLVKAVQQPEFTDFLQVVQSYSLTPAKDRPLKEEVFSAREKLVIQRVKEGRTNKEIAQELNVAEITIKKQLSLLYHRFQVKNRTQLLHAVEKM